MKNLNRRLNGRRTSQRRGASVVLVLGLLAITLAVSYAMMRTQVTSLQIQTNLDRRDDAREAALTGMAVALRRIHEDDWEGVDKSISGTLAGGAIYEVTFVTGDESLQPDDTDYAEYPFRLTLTSTGSDAGRRSEYHVTSVVQLVRRAFAADPAAWSDASGYTLYQWADEKTIIQIPARIEGAVRLGGTLDFCKDYPDSGSPLTRYLADLEKLRENGRGDYRPFNDTITLPFDRTDSATRSLLTDQLNLTLQDSAWGGAAPLAHPGDVSTYRLYDGGKEYEVPVIQSTYGYEIANIKIQGDPLTNPLGVFRSQGNLRLKDGALLVAAVITNGLEPDIDVTGTGVTWSPPELPPLANQSAGVTVHLPAALVQDDFRVGSGAELTLQGAFVVWDELEVAKGVVSTQLSLHGRVLADQVEFLGYHSWDAVNWTSAYNDFMGLLGVNELLGGLLGDDRYFPGYMQSNYGLQMAAKITMKAGPLTATYRWQDWSQPVYVPDEASGDDGLIWDLVRWSESR